MKSVKYLYVYEIEQAQKCTEKIMNTQVSKSSIWNTESYRKNLGPFYCLYLCPFFWPDPFLLLIFDTQDWVLYKEKRFM
jgi:hypothetical protein